MKYKSTYLTLFVVLYLVFLLISVPASWLMSFVQLPKGVNVSELSGSLWHSHIEQVQVQQVVVNDIELSLSPLSLLTLNPGVEVSFGGGLQGSALQEGPRGEAKLSNFFSDLSVENAKVKLDAQFVVEQAKLPMPVEAHNQLILTVDHYVVGKPYCQQLSASAQWPKAAVSAFNETFNLGAVSLNLACLDGNIEAKVVEGNDLGLSFTGILAKNNRFSGRGYLKPGAKFPEQLKPMLSFLGKKDGQGRYTLKL